MSRTLPFRLERLVQFLAGPTGPLQPGLGVLMADFGQLDLAQNGRPVLQVDALFVLLDRDLGHLAGELGVLVRRLGRLGGDLLVDQLVAKRGRVELADELALLDLGPIGQDRDELRAGPQPG